MKIGYRLFAFFVLISIFVNQNAQIITTEPALPLANTSVTIFYDATLGTAGLKDYTGDVYAHTGLITEKSTGDTDWKYVKTDWGENTAATKLTRVSQNLYSLEFSPSIRDYYGVPETEVIEKMAFVFRSSDNSKEGKGDNSSDIFVGVFEPGLNVSIISPDNNLMINPGAQIELEAASSETAELELFLNNTSVKTASGTTLSHTFDFNIPGDFWLTIFANTDEESDSDSVFIHVLDAQTEEARPDGIMDGITYVDAQTIQLVLHAPGKETVFAIGDFNNWTPSSNYRMSKDGERWWITINELEAGKEYAFQYLVDGELLIADPYTEKVLDPTNDKWISEETYPDLKPYPSGLTSGITSVFQTAQESYQWKNIDYTAPPKETLVIYELLVRDFILAHDWSTLTDTLDYFSNLGITAIELMPFNEFEGNESWGYNPSFYFAADKYYGPKESLQVFVDSCHGRGIAVIMDMTLNHSFSQSPLVQLYFNTSTYKVTSENPWYNVDSPNTSYSWGYDFDHESAATQAFVDRINKHWLTEFDLDGFRFDFTKGFTNTPGDGWAYDAARISILKRMAGEIRKINPEAYIILEHLADNSEESELSDEGFMLWGNINSKYNEATMGYN
ncbi:MAG: alpha-amylase family glycosyl hydrolase, partial [Bacteroidales bacterium]|nr:alpha-amylase family glycosyl hydrolase [Bacteroidales bacterium]